MRSALYLLVSLVLFSGCDREPVESVMSSGAALSSELDAVAKDYVLLVLALGEHDGDFVDAYHGPAEWREQARTNALTPAQIATASQRLRNELDGIEPDDELVQQRVTLLGKQLLAVQTRAQQLDGVEFSFDQEAQRLYDVLPPSLPQSHFDELLGQLDRLLPGEGSVSQRRNRLQADFEIPTDKLDAVFSEAIAECQRRTQAYIDLPEGERFVVEYVNDKPWSGYNWFQGDAYSLIQVNTDLPIYIDRAIDLACHEGYPGHHVFNTLLERELVEKRGWMEFSVYPLFSPMSLIAEGSANYGIQMAFPGDERERYEAEVLFPLAGLNSERVDEYYAIERLAEQLNHAGNEAARRYLDGDIDAATAQKWLEDYALMSPERAAQRVRFIERYRSYVINYNLGQDLVREYVERGADAASSRWQRFERLLSTPISASMLQQ